MGKSSSSLKKKRSKKSSLKAKASRSKYKKYKAKKVHHREASLSSSDYDDSQSLDKSTSSSAEDNSYRRKRDQSRTRKDVKARKKRARRRSHSRDSCEEPSYARKRKKAKRKKGDDEVREKPYRRKNIRREASVDSVSSRSLSCSTCQGGSASDDDDQYESHRRRSERKEKDKRRPRGRSRNERSSRYRARSCSSCSHCSESSYEGTKEKYTGEENSRRLRSVVTVTREAEESRELCRNETKEEIVDDHDYPCRSNDSNDGGTKRELDYHTLLASEEKLRVEDEKGDLNADLNLTEPKPNACGAETSESLKKETSETFGANLNGDYDLESLLRQRALENFRKFQGQIHSTAKDSNLENKIVSGVKQPITDERELVEGKPIVNDTAAGTKFHKRTPVEATKLMVGESTNNGSTSAAACVASHGNNDNVNNRGLSSAASRPSVHGLKFKPPNLNKGEDDAKADSQSELKQTSASHEPPNAKMTENDAERNATKTTQAAIQSINDSGVDADELRNSATPKSSLGNTSVENDSGKLQEEASQGSQFEQKTMNVMRGGEMVQVSYKVYIPNKAPALARRQLKR